MPTVFTCSCGAKIRLQAQHTGQAIRCPRCRQPIPVTTDAPDGGAVATAPAVGMTCPVCQTAIAAHEQWKQCPTCQQVHHQECWTEVGGCATYGCDQAPKMEKAAPASQPLSAWGDDKKCPVCGEKIKAIAIKCRYCNHEFASVDPMTAEDVRNQAVTRASVAVLRNGTIAVFVISLVLGCLAPITMIVALAWLVPKRREVARAGPLFVVLMYASIVVSALYSVLGLIFFLGSLMS